jgi:hypothetical protein
MQPDVAGSPAAKRTLRIAVVGDPHFVASDHALAPGSYLKFDSKGEFIPKHASQHPWAALTELVRTNPLAQKADLVLCVGDLSSGGDRLALETGWRHLNELARLLGAQIMACATGNHDVRSRSSAKEVLANAVRNLGNSRGLNENLKLLNPPYPLVDLANLTGVAPDDLRTRYFGTNVALVTTPQYRLVVLNSCAEHTAENFDFEKGAFPASTKEALLKALAASADPRLNVLVCHHPPSSHGYFGENNYDFISGGGELLTALEEHGAWLVVHGHKHHGHLTYAPGGGRSPIVFAAGSLGATLSQSDNGFRNQFYMIELEAADEDIRGMVRAWDWYHGMGYQQANRKNGGIFDGCGFGFRRSPGEIAALIAAASTGKLPIRWDEVRKAVPDLAHVIPSEYPLIEALLKRKHAIVVEPDSQENWFALGKVAP